MNAEDVAVFSLFEMDATSGSLRLRPGQQLDWEARSSYVVRVVVTDGGGLQTEAEVTVSVTDIDDAFISGFRYLEDTDAAILADGTRTGDVGVDGGEGDDGPVVGPGGDAGNNGTAAPGGNDGAGLGGNVQFGTEGGDWVVLQGSGFSPLQSRVSSESLDLSTYALTATYGPSSNPTRYTASGCYFVQPGFEVACQVAEGVGSGHVWALRLVDASTSRDHTAVSSQGSASTSYASPSITATVGVGGTGNVLSTRGSPDDSVSIELSGSDFGPVGTLVQVSYGPDGAESSFLARGCRVTNAHTEISCHPVPGVGGPLTFVATIGG